MKIVESNKGISILCLGAHSDDIEIGCGGSMLKIIRNHKVNRIDWVVFSSNPVRKNEALTSARQFLKEAGTSNVEILDFTDSVFPSQVLNIKESFEKIKSNNQYDLIFTHYRYDLHQDHKVISNLTWNTFRNSFILEYEIPKWDGDIGNPNVYISIPEEIASLKNQILTDTFVSQKNKHWFTSDTFNSLLRLRGIECLSTYAEAFYGRKITLF